MRYHVKSERRQQMDEAIANTHDDKGQMNEAGIFAVAEFARSILSGNIRHDMIECYRGSQTGDHMKLLLKHPREAEYWSKK